MNKNFIKSTLFVSLFFLAPLSAQGKTVKDIIRDIEKKQGRIPVYKLKQSKKRDRVNLAIVKPSNRFSTVFPEGSAERNYEEKLNKEIEQLHYLSKKLKSKDTKQRIWIRLAKGYSEKAALIERREQEKYDKRLKMYFAGSTSRKPVLDLAKSKSYNKKALDLYKYYIKTYPKAKDLDQVLFFLGYNSMGLGKTQQAVGYYKQLSDRFPSSEYINEANLSLGDYYFDKDRRNSAKKYYSKVAKQSRSSLGALALYKLSWVNHKMGNHQEGLNGLLKVIGLSKNSGVRGKKNLALASEAKKDLPMFYAEAGDPRKAFTYFTNIMKRDEASRALEKLAYYYVDKGDKEEATYLFSKLIKLNPGNDKSFDYQYSLVNMQASTGRGDLYERELYKWVNQFGPKSKWAKRSKDREKVKDAVSKAELSLRSHVLKIHNDARTQKSKTKMLRAEKGYKIYLSNFDKTENSDEMRFYYGELLYDLGAYKDAYAAYQQVGGDKYSKKAKLNSVLSLEKTIPKDEEVRKLVGKSTKKLPLNKSEERFIAAAKAYLSKPENKEQRADIKYRVASIYYSHNYFDKSEVVFKEIISEFPTSKYAGYSSDLIIDSYKLKKDYDGLEKAGKELIQIGKKSGGVKTSKVESVLEQSAFKKVEALTKTGKSVDVAKSFMEFTEKYPQSALKNKAYYNAGIYYEKGGAFKEALDSYALVQNSIADKKLYTDAQKFSAFLYEKSGNLRKAARAYEAISEYPSTSNKDRLKYLTNASIIREGFNDAEGLKRIFSRLKRIDKVSNTYLYQYRLADTYQRIGQFASARRHYINFFNKAKGSPFLLVKSARYLGDYYIKTKDIPKSKYWFRATLLTYEKYKRSGAKDAVSDAAYAAFKLSDKLFYDYLAVKIPSDPVQQKRVINKKLALVDKINKEMTKVINFDDGYTIVSALNRVGQAYQHLTFSILSTPLPKGLSPEEQKTVKGLLNKTVEPFKVNAITSYKKALEKGRSLNTYNAEYLNTLYELSKIDSEYSKYRVPFVLDSKTIQFDAETSKLYPDAFKAVTLTEDIVLEKFGAGLAESSSNFKPLFALANFYHYKGFSKISNIYLDKLLKSDQKKAVVLNLRGLNKYIENDKRKAITHFRAALSEDPSNAAASFNLSSLFGKYGGFEEGYELIKEVYSSPKLPPVVKHIALNNYAVGLISKERMDEANAELKASLELASEYLPAVANMSILKTTIQKDKKLSNQYLGQYKRLAKSRVDLDRIKLLENMKL